MKASNKDIRRTIFRNKKRFCSILIITALGVMMLSGLKAACDDLRYSADQFYDEQQVFDIQVVSTMGLNAVSYTHLDVYKRQELSRCEMNRLEVPCVSS